MSKKELLFNKIAAIYGLFFNYQVKSYRRVLLNAKMELDFSAHHSIIDIGCGTGALCKVLKKHGMNVTGLDPAEDMLAVARKKVGKTKPDQEDIKFLHGNVLTGLPFQDKSFDLAISSYVAHGLMPEERQSLYDEMKRIAKYAAILHDYNERRSLIIDITERLEGGGYFSFIENIQDELTNKFGNVKVVNTGRHSALYICKTDN